ncbi:uncharacterized protein LOC132350918 [Balaenoptera ricei]|uniref:uncharacterized protein LOC132350918 n=1 Tax=Balaenoptera ricei TaxID=2746895 RepID=UPI0028BE6CE4|nr:uncharacterized protein LOC132350918 [Balaenoptera ricei]XP_059756500.1 uncharacterized protein LOC132350918 [Balaenoptera ricei]
MTVDPDSSRLWLVVPLAQILEPQPSVSLEGCPVIIQPGVQIKHTVPGVRSVPSVGQTKWSKPSSITYERSNGQKTPENVFPGKTSRVWPPLLSPRANTISPWILLDPYTLPSTCQPECPLENIRWHALTWGWKQLPHSWKYVEPPRMPGNQPWHLTFAAGEALLRRRRNWPAGFYNLPLTSGGVGQVEPSLSSMAGVTCVDVSGTLSTSHLPQRKSLSLYKSPRRP